MTTAARPAKDNTFSYLFGTLMSGSVFAMQSNRPAEIAAGIAVASLSTAFMLVKNKRPSLRRVAAASAITIAVGVGAAHLVPDIGPAAPRGPVPGRDTGTPG